MGVLEWGDVARFLVACAGAGGSLVAAFWGLMRLFRPMAETAATGATDRLYDRLRQHDFPALGDRIERMEARVDKRFARVDERFARVDKRFDRVDKRFDRVDERFDRVEEHFARVEESMTRLRETAREDLAAILAAIDGLAATKAAGAARREAVGRGSAARG